MVYTGDMPEVLHVSLDNEAAVTAYYSSIDFNRKLMGNLFTASAALFHVQTHYEDGADEQIRAETEAGRQMLIAHTHSQFIDPLVLASMVERESALHEIGERGIVVPGRSKLFNSGIYGGVIRNSGVAIPVYLRKDHPDASREEIQEANKSQIKIVTARMNRGEHAAIYPEGSVGDCLEKIG